ncbi:uncharacterized protein IWZ02DRAFT_457903 [Phyllosticta citriasiana]|uniref:uncharacterized protein n=1 Tax=Phyllosticta citriasiana TaxID=595635 RepID=UPI0030FD6573
MIPIKLHFDLFMFLQRVPLLLFPFLFFFFFFSPLFSYSPLSCLVSHLYPEFLKPHLFSPTSPFSIDGGRSERRFPFSVRGQQMAQHSLRCLQKTPSWVSAILLSQG